MTDMRLEAADFAAMESRYRATLANCLSGYKPAKLVIGEVVLALLPEGSVAEDGALDINALGSVAVSGLDTYHSGRRLKRMAYARPDQPPRVVA